ncbi:MAG: hypothetical protein IJ033_05315 [Clostridia bacterium]|nr:hypothetical protein [Clostridia bacterium]
MKKVSILFLITMVVMLLASLFAGSIIAYAEDEITVEFITKVNSDGNIVSYDDTYSRDVTVTYNFSSASHYVIRVYAKEGATYQLVRATENQKIVDGNGSYTVIDDGDIRLDCVAKDSASKELAIISTYVKSDVSAPTRPTIDPDGVLDAGHSVPFSVGYVVGYDNLSGVDFERSTYRFEDSDGAIVIPETTIHNGYDKALIAGINQNGTIVLTIYDKAGNFVVERKDYTLHYYVNSSAPTITITPENGYSQNVMVSIVWPIGVSYYSYRLVVNGTELPRKTYTVPFSIDDEGTVAVQAYYYADGVETYVTKSVTNVDKTAPSETSIAESIRAKVDLTSTAPVVLSLRVLDAKSGIKKVYLKNFGSEFTLSDINTYSMDVTPRLGTNITVVAEDNAGNKVEYSYPLNGFDRNKIEYYSETFQTLNSNTYDSYGWSEVLNAYNRLSNLMGSQDTTSGKIAEYAQAVDDAISGNHNVKVTLSEIIDGLSNDFKAEVGIGATSVKKGGKLNLTVKKINYSEAELNEKMTIAATIAKFPAYSGYGFNLKLSAADGSDVTIYNRYNVSLTIPDSNKLAKVYYESDGILTQLSATIDNGVITFSAEGDGNFYLIVEKTKVEEQGKGLMIGEKFYSMELLLIAGGIILGAIILVGVLTPLIYKLVKDKKLRGKKFNYLK